MKKTLYLTWVAIVAIFIVCSCSSDSDPVVPEGPPPPHLNKQDSLALVAIYKEGGGEFWDYKWDLNDCETWVGGRSYLVDPETNEYRLWFLHLVCNTNDVVGTLSEEIGKLTELKVLLMDGRGFGGNLPASLSELKNLEEVSIIKTSLSGKIPEGILSLPKLKFFTIDGCRLSGELPKDITETSPTVLNMGLMDNHLSGKLPSGIKVRWLNLDGNDYTEYPFEYLVPSKDPDFAGPCIFMRDNKISGIIPDSILNDPKLITKLDVYSNPQKKGYGFSNAPEDWNRFNK